MWIGAREERTRGTHVRKLRATVCWCDLELATGGARSGTVPGPVWDEALRCIEAMDEVLSVEALANAAVPDAATRGKPPRTSSEVAGGGCLCGAVSYKLQRPAAPLQVLNCHCSICQRSSGASVSTWVSVARANFELGEEHRDSSAARLAAHWH